MIMTKAHLVFEDYKKVLNTLKDSLPKEERDAMISDQDIRKKKEALMDIEKTLRSLDEAEKKENSSLNALKDLE